jgi:hypothetical protein
MMKPPLRVFTSLGHQAVEVRMQIYLLSKGLDRGHNPRSKLCAGCGLKVFEKCLDCCLAKIPQKPELVLEEDAQHLGNDKDDLAVRDIQEKLLAHPLAPLLKPLGVAGWTKSAATT